MIVSVIVRFSTSFSYIGSGVACVTHGSAVTGYFDGDAYLDLAVMGDTSSGGLSVLNSTPTGT